ncbi:50S ribosomal protein L6, chloroplastic [Sesbania bispinosa]|nr:50S ribosomal protein L6, chloroplastic [Sesbania bispinosa]
MEVGLTYPQEVVVDREESRALRIRKAVETRSANQMHGLFRVGPNAWSLMYPSIDDKLQSLYNNGYKLVCSLYYWVNFYN